MTADERPPTHRSWHPWLGLVLGPSLGSAAFLALPAELSYEGRITFAILTWMGTWWLTEATHVSVTALLPLALFPITGATGLPEAAAPYAHPLIFLYFGGFLLALSMQRWGLGERVALLTLRCFGTSAWQMVAGFMLVTAVFSAFVSNTATAAMMLPIASSVIELVRKTSQPNGQTRAFGTCLMLGIAYAASIGGMATIVGSPTNAFLVGFLKDGIAEPYRADVGFAQWLAVGACVSGVLLPLTYIFLTQWAFPIRTLRLEDGDTLILQRLQSLGPMQPGEWNTLILFLATVGLWLTRPWLCLWSFEWRDETWTPFAGLTDTGIVLLTTLILFVLPVDRQKRVFTMDWDTACRMPWGVLILFGGGLSLAAAVRANGVAEFLGSFAGGTRDLPGWLITLFVTSGIVSLTELTSNTATTASLVPILAAMAPQLDRHPYLLIVPATLASSCAFMLPVATPPNAIVFGTGEVTVRDMLRAGIWLNLLSVVVITTLAQTVLTPLMDTWQP